ncbi:hypothetical protein BYT27DRAFT_7262738 [Phlegmacium glaucopus]|nr:hypothetical protein BYT27DRAFT_7262738 [Phlegmacium glaucopus]
MRRRPTTSASIKIYRSASKSAPVLPLYSHVSTYRSLKLELQLYSPSRKFHEDSRGPMAVFADRDQVSGKVILDSSCYPDGTLTISIEGALLYPSFDKSAEGVIEILKYAFLSLQTTIKVSNSAASSSMSSFRDAFTRRHPSLTGISLSASSFGRSHPFSFNLPQSVRPGEEMPSAFTSTKGSNNYQVIYNVIVHWQPSDSFELPSHLEVPFLLQPDVEFQCADASPTTPWLEMPLKSDRPLPFRAAITVPTSMAFSRSSYIPYFVVFTTTPRSPALAKEVATDATISVSLIRQVVVSKQSLLSPRPPLTSGDNPESLRSRKRLRQTCKPQSKLTIMLLRDKPIPEPPVQKSFFDVQTIHKDMCIGFPKRPRYLHDAQSHPTLKAIAALPDGLHKTRIQLNSDMLPSIDWAGISVKYYLDVSVLFGPDNLRARIPIRIF